MEDDQISEAKAVSEAVINNIVNNIIIDANSDNSEEIETSALVTISEFLSPIYLPKKPEIIEAKSGRNIIESSIINLSTYLFLQLL